MYLIMVILLSLWKRRKKAWRCRKNVSCNGQLEVVGFWKPYCQPNMIRRQEAHKSN